MLYLTLLFKMCLHFTLGLGEKGDRVSVRPKMGYENLLLPGFAVYPTPNNIKRYCDPTTEKVEKVYSSPYVQRVSML